MKLKYENILATEDGHSSKTENVWQSGYAAGWDVGREKAQQEIKALREQNNEFANEIERSAPQCERMKQALRDIASGKVLPQLIAQQALKQQAGEVRNG